MYDKLELGKMITFLASLDQLRQHRTETHHGLELGNPMSALGRQLGTSILGVSSFLN